MAVPRYQGRFGVARGRAPALARRLRPAPGRGGAARAARARRRRALADAAGRREVVGPPPHDEKGRSLAPADAWGHDHLWWLDRMVRTSRPLVERMTLNLHDWFATSNSGVGSQKLMLAQNRLLRRYALGNFGHLLTVDHGRTRRCSSGSRASTTSKGSPNENYGRELMELFTLGEGNGYGERDVREQARALTGWTSTWKRGKGDDGLPVRRAAARRGHEGDLRQARDVLVARRGAALPPPPAAPRVLRHEALGLLRPRGAELRDTGGAWRRSTARAATRSGPCSTRSCGTRRCTRARGW